MIQGIPSDAVQNDEKPEIAVFVGEPPDAEIVLKAPPTSLKPRTEFPSHEQQKLAAEMFEAGCSCTTPPPLAFITTKLPEASRPAILVPSQDVAWFDTTPVEGRFVTWLAVRVHLNEMALVGKEHQTAGAPASWRRHVLGPSSEVEMSYLLGLTGKKRIRINLVIVFVQEHGVEQGRLRI
jgi:hypothetical protein